MLIANNFDNLRGWLDYEANPHFHDISPTWAKLLKWVVPSTGVPLTELWFTNYSLGVIIKKHNRYEFRLVPTRSSV